MIKSLTEAVFELAERFRDGVLNENGFDDAMRDYERLECAIKSAQKRLRILSRLRDGDYGGPCECQDLICVEEKLFRLEWELRSSVASPLLTQAERWLNEDKLDQAHRALKITWSSLPGTSVVHRHADASEECIEG